MEDWIQRRRSPLGVYRPNPVNTNVPGSAQTGPSGNSTSIGVSNTSQAGKSTGALVTSGAILSGSEASSLRRPTLALPLRRLSSLRSTSETGALTSLRM